MESKLLTLYSDVKAVPVRWLWYPYIAIGKITLLQGDPGDGKSTMMMNLIAELSKGGATPDGKALGRPQRIIYQCSEDGACDTIKPRLESCGADCRNIAFINEEIYDGLRQCIMVIIHTESFSPRTQKMIQYSVSTKIADSLLNGPCLIAYGPEKLASIDYLKKIRRPM